MTKFEIEKRGSLPQTLSKSILLETLSSDFDSTLYTKELVIFFRYEHDVRFKFIHDTGEFVLKKKLANQSNQKEWITHVRKEDIRNFLYQLVHLGYKEGLLSTGERYVFKSGDLELCLKYNTPIGNFFEIEKIIDSQIEIVATEIELMEILEKHNLIPWKDEEYSLVKETSLKSLKKISLLNSANDDINDDIINFIYQPTT